MPTVATGAPASITAEEAANVWGCGTRGMISPWIVETAIQQRSATSGTQNIIARSINEQTQAYYADSAPDQFDKRNVRNGHHLPWGYEHLIVKLDVTTDRALQDPLRLGGDRERSRALVSRAQHHRARAVPRRIRRRCAAAGWLALLRYSLAVQNGEPIGEKSFPVRDPNHQKDWVGRLGIDGGEGRAGCRPAGRWDHRRVKLSLFLDLQNLTNRKNPERADLQLRLQQAQQHHRPAHAEYELDV